MSHLLDTNICAAHFRRPGGLAHRFVQYGGGLFIPTIVLGELYAGAYHSANPAPLLRQIADLLDTVAAALKTAGANSPGGRLLLFPPPFAQRPPHRTGDVHVLGKAG